MNQDEIKLGQLVAFKWEGETQYGYVLSIEHGIANIRGIEQTKTSRPAYHFRVVEIQPAYIHYSTKPDFIDPSTS